MEGFGTETARQIASQGLGYLLFIGAVCVIGWLIRNARQDNLAAATKADALVASRIEEAKADAKELLGSANTTATSNSAVAVAMAAQTAAITKLTEALADLLKDNEHGREIWQLQLKSLMDGQAAIRADIAMLMQRGAHK